MPETAKTLQINKKFLNLKSYYIISHFEFSTILVLNVKKSRPLLQSALLFYSVAFVSLMSFEGIAYYS